MNGQPGFQPQVPVGSNRKSVTWIILVVVVIALFFTGYAVGGLNKNSQISSLRSDKEKLEKEKEKLSKQVKDLEKTVADNAAGVKEVTYKNSSLGYQFSYISNLILVDYSAISTMEKNNIVALEKNNKSVFTIKVDRKSGGLGGRGDEEYLNQPSSGTITINGQTATKHEFPEGVIEEGRRTDPFIAYKVVTQSRQYVLEFYGSTNLSETQQRILNSFKFL